MVGIGSPIGSTGGGTFGVGLVAVVEASTPAGSKLGRSGAFNFCGEYVPGLHPEHPSGYQCLYGFAIGLALSGKGTFVR